MKHKVVSMTTLIALAIGLAGCGGQSVGSLLSGCVIADVSSSTRPARALYTSAFSSFSTQIGQHGSGNVCVILAAGEPQAEGAPAWVDVGPSAQYRNSPDFAPAEVASAVRSASLQFAAVLAHPDVTKGGSALVEAAVVAARVLHPGDRLLFLSDGMQNSHATGNFEYQPLDGMKIKQILDSLAQQGLLADLRGVQIEFPYMLYHPGGWSLNDSQQQEVLAFWRAWAARTGATLSAGQNTR